MQQLISGFSGRILALDYGKKRIGLAISDALGITAQGLPTLVRTRIREDLAQLQDLAREREVGLLVFGNPLYMSGDESRQSSNVREFAGRLHDLTKIPLAFWDERFTSVEASRVLLEGGVKGRDQKGKVDRIAASLLLESYLEALSFASEESDGGGE